MVNGLKSPWLAVVVLVVVVELLVFKLLLLLLEVGRLNDDGRMSVLCQRLKNKFSNFLLNRKRSFFLHGVGGGTGVGRFSIIGTNLINRW